jgi:hypothetical protein
MPSARSSLATAMMVIASCMTTGERCRGQPPADADSDEARKMRLDFMKDFRSEFDVFRRDRADQPLEAMEEPVQRWSNPIRNFFSDGGLFLWLEGKRPAAAAAISIRGNGGVWTEMATFSSSTLRCVRRGAEFWTPQSVGDAQQRLADAPAPAESARLRLVQMRRLCEQFTVRNEPVNDQPTELRLMPQPIYRFEDDASGVFDGALFAFVETTDPETLLLLEAVKASGAEAMYWRHTLARMTSRRLVARRGESVVWSVPGYWLNPRSINDTYQERQLGVYPPPHR